MSLTGSCHCGSVRYEAGAIDGELWNCSCQTCRKTHSADHNTAARVLRHEFRVVSGTDALTAYESSPGKLRHFCSKCGAHIFAEKDGMPFVVIRAGSLDVDPLQTPAMEVWLSHARPWLASTADMPRFDKAPT